MSSIDEDITQMRNRIQIKDTITTTNDILLQSVAKSEECPDHYARGISSRRNPDSGEISFKEYALKWSVGDWENTLVGDTI